MSSYTLPSIETVPQLSTVERSGILDALFEPCAALHTLSVDLLHTTTYTSYKALISDIGSQLVALSQSISSSDTEWLDMILKAHPRLGARKVDSVQSQAEQAQLNGDGEELERLRALNEKYEETFSGLIYVVFVNGRSRPDIMKNMQTRIERGDIKAERLQAILAMCDIAEDRARKLQIC